MRQSHCESGVRLIKLTSVYRDWIVDMTPDALPDGFEASAWVQREAGEGETQGENLIFPDLGHYAIQVERADASGVIKLTVRR